jgi:hypothetical protein
MGQLYSTTVRKYEHRRSQVLSQFSGTNKERRELSLLLPYELSTLTLGLGFLVPSYLHCYLLIYVISGPARIRK